ncbi:hypothetical protein ACQP2F_14380 [Actinoplanes sp. CA-030573]|uniref:hypothetical protein n=1 Tax=Actinoplanes sp. CA-030573 TaxID=3239898 RepID=UPI003D8AB49E
MAVVRPWPTDGGAQWPQVGAQGGGAAAVAALAQLGAQRDGVGEANGQALAQVVGVLVEVAWASGVGLR